VPILLLQKTEDDAIAALVRAALVRSFSVTQVQWFPYENLDWAAISPSQVVCLLNPSNTERHLLHQLATGGRKLLLLGHLGAQLAADLGLEVAPLIADSQHWGTVRPTEDKTCDASLAAVCYDHHPLTARLSLKHRPLSRYDFTNEWNTLGFGRIAIDDSPWSLCQQAQSVGATALASVNDDRDHPLTLYAAIADQTDSSVLWFNRAVGPLDGLEWVIIETFCSDYRADDLACIPHVREVPAGYAGAVTMRLDCDQAIATARPLFELYQDMGVPLSLAVVTELPPQAADMAFLRTVLASGGAVVSHSCTHPPNWGVNYDAALQEAQRSRQWLAAHLPEAEPVRYAVSPFHQNPPYAVRALADAGYCGFVGGIIHNDPEYLLGRSGQVPWCEAAIVSHSQQCMLHGDCYHRYGNSVAPFCESFSHHWQAGSLFGYLDHPFSATYQYGWDSEAERLAAHAALLKFIQSHDGLWFPNLVQGLEFVRKRSLVRLRVDGANHLQIHWQSTTVPLQAVPPLQVRWRGATITVAD